MKNTSTQNNPENLCNSPLLQTLSIGDETFILSKDIETGDEVICLRGNVREKFIVDEEFKKTLDKYKTTHAYRKLIKN